MSLTANLVVTESNILPSDPQWSATGSICLEAVFHFSVSMSLISRIIIQFFNHVKFEEFFLICNFRIMGKLCDWQLNSNLTNEI